MLNCCLPTFQPFVLSFCISYRKKHAFTINQWVHHVSTANSPSPHIRADVFAFVTEPWHLSSLLLFRKSVPYSKAPQDGRFGPKFYDPRTHPMRGDSIPIGVPFGRPTRPLRTSCRRGLRAHPWLYF